MLGIEPISSRTKTFESHILDINVEHWIIQVFAKKKKSPNLKPLCILTDVPPGPLGR